MSSQVLQRVSIRWLPDPPFEDTETIALNVGGYYLDLRVTKKEGSVQWSRAGERKVACETPFKYQWSRIIDSTNILDADEAYWNWEVLGNGDAFEDGSAKCPFKNNALTPYEEVWRDVTQEGPIQLCFILQSVDLRTFLGCVGRTFIGMRSAPDGSFAVRRDEWEAVTGTWKMRFQDGSVDMIPRVDEALQAISTAIRSLAVGAKIVVDQGEFVVRAYEGSS